MHDLFFTYEGRINQKTYWLCLLKLLLAGAPLVIPYFWPKLGPIVLSIIFIYSIFVLRAFIDISVKRLHDFDYTGLWVLLIVFGHIGCLILITMCFLKKGDKSPNYYGVVPEDGAIGLPDPNNPIKHKKSKKEVNSFGA